MNLKDFNKMTVSSDSPVTAFERAPKISNK